jgi:hypothetical protein
VAELLIERGICDDPALASSAAARGEGSLQRAALWCDSTLADFRAELLGILSQPEIAIQGAAKSIGSFVDAAGKESAAKRQRLRLVVSLAEEFYRAALMQAERGQSPSDSELAAAVSAALRWMPADAAPDCLDVCLDCFSHIDSNANQATLIEWWLDELAEAARNGRIAAQ